MIPRNDKSLAAYIVLVFHAAMDAEECTVNTQRPTLSPLTDRKHSSEVTIFMI